jgi:hypothetical protein
MLYRHLLGRSTTMEILSEYSHLPAGTRTEDLLVRTSMLETPFSQTKKKNKQKTLWLLVRK